MGGGLDTRYAHRSKLSSTRLVYQLNSRARQKRSPSSAAYDDIRAAYGDIRCDIHAAYGATIADSEVTVTVARRP